MEIQTGVFMLEASPHSHVFLIQGEENILIDTGMPGQGNKILQELAPLGIDPKSIRHILLTHHDVDHIGNAAQMEEATGAQLWAPTQDIPYIARESQRPGVKRIINAIFKTKIPGSLQPIPPGWEINGVKAVASPGHTPGHTIFIYKKIAFAGDLLRIRGGVPSLSPKYMNWDYEQAKRSIGLLFNFETEWICPAHGQPAIMNGALRSFIAQYAR